MKASHLHDSHRFLVPAFGGSNPPAPANRILVIWLWYSDLQPKPDPQRLDRASLSLPGFDANCAGFCAMIFSRPGAGWSWTRVEENRFPRHPSMRFRLVLSLTLRHLAWRLCQFLCLKNAGLSVGGSHGQRPSWTKIPAIGKARRLASGILSCRSISRWRALPTRPAMCNGRPRTSI